jgi:hypothetical protein
LLWISVGGPSASHARAAEREALCRHNQGL